VKFLLKFLNILNTVYVSNELDLDFIDILRSNIFDIKQTDIFKILNNIWKRNYSLKFKRSIFDYINDDLFLRELELSDIQSIIEFRELYFDLQQNISQKNIASFISYLFEKTGLIDYLETTKKFDDLEDVFTFFTKIQNYLENDKSFDIKKLLFKISLYEKYNISLQRSSLSKNIDWVQVLTAHSSKWLEYNTVFITNCIEWNWNWKRARSESIKIPTSLVWEWYQDAIMKTSKEDEKEHKLQEERRLFFVALTRAKDELYLTYSASTNNKINLKSQFLTEIDWNFEVILQKFDTDDLSELVLTWLKEWLITYTKDEISYIKAFLDNYRLSPSDLNLFLDDPKVFLREKIFKYPFIQNKYTIFGTIYHRCLELFFTKYKETWKLPDSSYMPATFELLLAKYPLSQEEYDEALEKWKTWLKWYYETYCNIAKKPLVLEKDFKFSNIEFNWVPLTWKIDKIESSPLWEEWNNSKIKISLIDYKTWSIKTENVIKWKTRNSNKNYFRQLLFYKLLCEQDYELKDNYEVDDLVIDFVEWKDWIYKRIKRILGRVIVSLKILKKTCKY